MFTRLQQLAGSGLLLAVCLASGYAADAASSHVEVTGDRVNIRSGPGLTYDVISSVNAKTTLPVITQKNDWYQITLPNGKTGWITSQYAKAVTPAAQPSTPAPAATGKSYIESKVDSLNVRTAPNTSSAVIQQINPKTKYLVLKKDGDWMQIQLSGQKTGWVAGWLVEESKEAAASPQPPAEQPKQTITVPDTMDVHAGPGETYETIGQLSTGDTLQVLGVSNGWSKITYDGREGWILMAPPAPSGSSTTPPSDIAPAAPDQPAPPSTPAAETVRVNVDNLNLRATPSLEGQVLATLANGTSLTVLARQGDWIQVKTPDNKTGWVANWLVDDLAKKPPVVVTADSLKGKVIVVDAGHGGQDGGATGTHYKTLEKEVNLQVAQYLQAKLAAAGATVIMTRTDDSYPTLQNRVDIAVQNKADLFVSVHHNTHPNNATNGTIVFYYDKGKSSKLASHVQSELVRATQYKDMNARYGDYFVLRENPVPAILTEINFLTNAEDEAHARDPEYQALAAEGICKGIVSYFQSGQ